MGLGRYWQNDSVKIVAGAAAGYAVATYAPELQGYATTARQAVQGVRKSWFKGSDSNTLKTDAQSSSIFSMFSGARKEDASRIASDASRGSSSAPPGISHGGGMMESIKTFLRRLLA